MSSLQKTEHSQPLPDLDGKVHGIKSLDPWTVQCDDCLSCWSGDLPIIVAHSAVFNRRSGLQGLRLCGDCWNARGWFDGYSGWVFHPERVTSEGDLS